MQTQHIRYFLAICDELNFTRAARKCGISQPSLTNAVKRLEREVGGALFLRSTRPPYVELTALARKLHPTYVQLDTLLAELEGSNRKQKPLIAPAPAGGSYPVRPSTG